MRRALLPLLLIAAAPVALTGAQTPPAASTAEADARFNAFLDQGFDESIALSPEAMTSLGIKTNYDKLDDYTGAIGERRLRMAEARLARMRREFDPKQLGPQAQISYRLFQEQVERQRRFFRFRDYGFPVSTNGSPAGSIPAFLINQHRVTSVADAEAYIARLVEVERVMGEVADYMRRQAAKGIIPPQMVFEPARADARKILEGAPFGGTADSTLLADFRKKVGALQIAESEKARLIATAQAALTGPFKRGYDRFFAILDEIEPKATGNNGAWSLPDGAAYYAARLQGSTTTDLTADQIHRIGLDSVASIRREMDVIRNRVGFSGTLEQFFEHIRSDPRFKYPNTEAGRAAYLADARAVVDRIMSVSPRFFRTLPKAPLEVRAVEKWREGTAATAFYNRPAPDGSRPGIFYVNLVDMTQTQKVQMEAIAVHEGAPGHHFQIARAMEIQGLPKFRRFGGYGAYSEGWGLYSERLAKEMGGYTDPYSEFGMLSLQMWRAIRLVVDTGIHSKRWDRDRAIQYFVDNSSLSRGDIEREVNRYINNPGQATSYMIGQRKIAELRARAERALGSRFDIRDFHEAVLRNGALPLSVLEEEIDRWIAATRAS